mmetsp:Transcript_71751/g.200221  ORF Transcript_71751/g.200221 Transcript_71751/m.200221 type:complete len:403 (+) Transcript_71751:90-1298(+)
MLGAVACTAKEEPLRDLPALHRHRRPAQHVAGQVWQRALGAAEHLLPQVGVRVVPCRPWRLRGRSLPGGEPLGGVLVQALVLDLVPHDDGAPAIQRRLLLVLAGRRDVRLVPDGLVQVGHALAVAELQRLGRRLDGLPVGQHLHVVVPGRRVVLVRLAPLVWNAHAGLLADLARLGVQQGALRGLVLPGARKAVPPQVEAAGALRGVLLHIAGLALVDQLVFQRQERLDALDVALHLAAELVAPVALDTLNAVLGLPHVHEVEVLLLAAHLAKLRVLLAAGLHLHHLPVHLLQPLLAGLDPLVEQIVALLLHRFDPGPEEAGLVAAVLHHFLPELLQALLLGQPLVLYLGVPLYALRLHQLAVLHCLARPSLPVDLRRETVVHLMVFCSGRLFPLALHQLGL